MDGAVEQTIKAMKKIALGVVESKKPVNVLIGTVTGVNPLEITVDQRMTLTQEFLIIPRSMTDYTLDVIFPEIKGEVEDYNGTIDISHNHTISELTMSKVKQIHSHILDSLYLKEAVVNHNHNIAQLTLSNVNLQHTHDVTLPPVTGNVKAGNVNNHTHDFLQSGMSVTISQNSFNNHTHAMLSGSTNDIETKHSHTLDTGFDSETDSQTLEHEHTLVSGKTNKSGNENLSIRHKHEFTIPEERKTVKFENALKLKDSVILLRVQGGKKFLVMDKVMDR